MSHPPIQYLLKMIFYLPVTKSLEEREEASCLPDEFRDFIDHIIVTNVLKTIDINEAAKVADINFIENFETTTSDHAPVWTSFDFTLEFEDNFVELPDEFMIFPNYPNPFNNSTTISFELRKPTTVLLTVYVILWEYCFSNNKS